MKLKNIWDSMKQVRTVGEDMRKVSWPSWTDKIQDKRKHENEKGRKENT